MGSPRPIRSRPPMVMVSSARSPVSSLILLSSAARSGLPGGYCLIGSLTGGGTVVTASMAASWVIGIMGGPSHVDTRRPPLPPHAQGAADSLVLFQGPQHLGGAFVRRVERFDGQFLDRHVHRRADHRG